MKIYAYIFPIIFCLGVNGHSQNRIHEWDIEKITSVQIEFSSINSKQEILLFDMSEDIDKIISFLKNTEFKENVITNTLENPDHWRYKIDFQGHRDQVYLYENHVFIGKTRFVVDHKVIEEFGNLVKELQN